MHIGISKNLHDFVFAMGRHNVLSLHPTQEIDVLTEDGGAFIMKFKYSPWLVKRFVDLEKIRIASRVNVIMTECRLQDDAKFATDYATADRERNNLMNSYQSFDLKSPLDTHRDGFANFAKTYTDSLQYKTG
jgi:hypothetical protein